MSLLTLFCSYNPAFMDRLNSFSKLNQERLQKKLKSAENRAALRSTISEIRFGEFFQKLNFEIIYDEIIDKKTPDWILNNSTFPLICEVYRLGQSNKNQKRSDFENSLKQKLEKISSNLVLKVTIDDGYNNYDELEIDVIKKQVELWMIQPPINQTVFYGCINSFTF
jgi:hypothetical protein